MFRGSALTFGGVVYHGDAPFQRYTLNNANTGPGFLYAPRGTTSGLVTLDQDRTADYQAFFIEDLIRIGKFHIVPSFRLDHESVDVDATRRASTPGRGVRGIDRNADKLIPLWGIGLGNDFAGKATKPTSAPPPDGGPSVSSMLQVPARAVLPGGHARSVPLPRYRTRCPRHAYERLLVRRRPFLDAIRQPHRDPRRPAS